MTHWCPSYTPLFEPAEDTTGCQQARPAEVLWAEKVSDAHAHTDVWGSPLKLVQRRRSVIGMDWVSCHIWTLSAGTSVGNNMSSMVEMLHLHCLFHVVAEDWNLSPHQSLKFHQISDTTSPAAEGTWENSLKRLKLQQRSLYIKTGFTASVAGVFTFPFSLSDASNAAIFSPPHPSRSFSGRLRHTFFVLSVAIYLLSLFPLHFDAFFFSQYINFATWSQASKPSFDISSHSCRLVTHRMSLSTNKNVHENGALKCTLWWFTFVYIWQKC